MMFRSVCNPPMRRLAVAACAGFTLVEVMVTVAILAILTAVAIPIYTGYVVRSNVQSGLQGLAVMRTRMEQYFMDNRTYDNVGDCGATQPPNEDNFFYSCESPANEGTYIVTATGVTGTNMEGFTYTINQANERTSAINKDGWGTGATVPCWITRPGEEC